MSAGIVGGAVVAGTTLQYEVQVVDDYGNRNLEGLARVRLDVVDFLVDLFTGLVGADSDQVRIQTFLTTINHKRSSPQTILTTSSRHDKQPSAAYNSGFDSLRACL